MAFPTPTLVQDCGSEALGHNWVAAKPCCVVMGRQIPFVLGVPQPAIHPQCSFALGAELSPPLFPFAKTNQNKLSQMATNPLDNLRLPHVPTAQGNSSFASTL